MPTELGQPYPWIHPSSVSSEAKYRLASDGTIRLTYVSGQTERALGTNEPHPALVNMIRSVKSGHREPPSGVFYINEWRHVLVKAAGGTWFAGVYDTILEFDLGGAVISARAPNGSVPGAPWRGPRVGVRYALSASGDDVHCRVKLDKRTERQEFLSDYISEAAEFVRTFSRLRPEGGRIYINEARELFCPAPGGGQMYLGYVPVDRWFPEPQT